MSYGEQFRSSAEAATRLRGMFSHVAPDVSLADGLIADRRAAKIKSKRPNVAMQGTTALRSTLRAWPRIATT
jgi:hypothetical protein